MGFKEFIATGKGKAITIGSGVSVAAVGIVAAVLLQGEGFRSITVSNVEGDVAVVGEINNGQAYVGENLYSGDDVTVGDASELVMCMDNDKYVYADANTHFNLQASDAKDASKIKIYLDKGSELNKLESKLGPDESYEVDTPTSTMAVRGTTFRVTVYEDAAGNSYTLLEVTDGIVEVSLKTTDGKYNGEKMSFTAGQSALVRGNASISEFLVGEENEKVLILNYEKLPESAVPRLQELLKHVEGNMIVGDLELQGERNNDEEEAVEPTPTPTPEIVAVEEDGPEDPNTPDGDGDGTGEGDDDAAGTNGPMLAAAPRHAHTPGIWATVTAARCNTQGHEALLCAECNGIMDERIVPPTGHSFVNGVCKNCNYGAAAPASASAPASSSSGSSSSEPSHTHSWTYTKNGDSGHKKECSCGEVISEEAHSLTFPMPNYGNCSYCGYSGVIANCNEHTWNGLRCTVCGATSCESHVWNDGICSNCGIECSHTYSDASSSCSVCGKICTHSVLSGVAPSSSTGHKGTCSSCNIPVEEEHKWPTPIWSDEVGQYVGECTVCGKDGTYDASTGQWSSPL